MRLSTIQGVIDRRILVNYRVAPEVAARLFPAPFRPKLANGYAVAGICLIRLKQNPTGLRLRPRRHRVGERGASLCRGMGS